MTYEGLYSSVANANNIKNKRELLEFLNKVITDSIYYKELKQQREDAISQEDAMSMISCYGNITHRQKVRDNMIVIKNMKMPSSCYDCPFAKNERTNDYGSFCECGILEDYETINLLEHSKHPNCPLVEQKPVLDKIRAEIEQLRLHKAQFITGNNKVCIDSQEVLNVIDKYRTESEET